MKKLLLIPLILALFLTIANIGSGSTTIQLRAANTENLEDGTFDEDSTRDGSSDYLYCDLIDGTGEMPFIKFNISAVPSGQVIDDATLCMWAWISSDEDVDAFHVTNQSWAETDIDLLCGDGTICADVWNLLITNLDTQAGTNTNDEWVCWNVTDGVATDYAASRTKSSYALNHTGDTTDYYYFSSKEKAESAEHSYLNITYSAAPPADTCTPPASGDWYVKCSDNCTLSSNTVVTGTMFLAESGPGNFTLDASSLAVEKFKLNATACKFYMSGAFKFNMTG